jgi:hypothetical protein
MEHIHDFSPKKPPIDAELQFHLGVQLRRLFAETAHQPIPARFADLLEQLQLGGNSDCGGEAAHARPKEGDAARTYEAKR